MPERTPAEASAALRRSATASSWPSRTRAKEASGFFSRLLTRPLARSGWAGRGWSRMPRSSMKELIVLTVGCRSPWTTKMPVFSGGTTSAAGGGERLDDDDEELEDDDVAPPVEWETVTDAFGAGAEDFGATDAGAGAGLGVVTVTVTVEGADCIVVGADVGVMSGAIGSRTGAIDSRTGAIGDETGAGVAYDVVGGLGLIGGVSGMMG